MINLKFLTLFSGLFAFIVVALGAWTRMVDAGLGCPDWPGCYGFATIPLSNDDIVVANERFPESPYQLVKAIPEVVHRFFATSLGLFIIGIFYLLTKHNIGSRNTKVLSFFLLIWVCIQGLLGYLTVSLKLWPQVVSAHLMAGFLTTIILWILYFRIKDVKEPRTPWKFSQRTYNLISIGIILVTVQIFLGVWTSANYAALACSEFPLCYGEILPEADFIGAFNLTQPIGASFLGGQLDHESRLAIHLSHRFGALFLMIYLLFLAYMLNKDGHLNLSLGLLGLLFLQISLGISNIIFHLPLLVAVGHNLGALFLIIYLSVLRFR